MKHPEHTPKPPRWLDKFLEWYCQPEQLEGIQGDLYELFFDRMEEGKPLKAKLGFAWDVIRSFRLGAIKSFSSNFNLIMLRNYFKIAIRNIQRNRTFTSINVLGLVVGLTTSLLIFLWVNDEINFNKFHEKGDDIYRLWTNMHLPNGEIATWGNVPYSLVKVLEEEFPDVSKTVLISEVNRKLFSVNNEKIKELGFEAGEDIFEVFSFNLIQGDAGSVLDDPHSIVISEKLALKYFGEDWQIEALGKTVEINSWLEYKITGVFEDIPANSSLRFDFVTPMEELVSRQPWQKDWGNFNFQMYVLLDENSNFKEAEEKIKGAIVKHHPDSEAYLMLQSLSEEYLYSEIENGKVVGGRIEYARIFSLVAIFLLIIASINFMNLATAQSSRRSKEIGIRKVVGATRGSLINQFMGESILLVLISMIFASIAVEFLLPYFNDLTGKEIIIDYSNPYYWAFLLGVTLLTGIFAGSYPSFFLSSFKVVNILKGTLKFDPYSVLLRKGLVIFQFGLSIMLIIATMVVYKQMDYMMNKKLGLDKENLVYMSLNRKMKNNFDAIRNELTQNPGIESVSIANQSPLAVYNSTTDPQWEGMSPDQETPFSVIKTDESFVSSMKISLKDGRNFSKEFSQDPNNYLINEEAARVMGLKNPLDKGLEVWGRKGKIIGVMNNFHIGSLHEPIKPVILTFRPEDCWRLFVRTVPGKTQDAIASLEKVHFENNPEFPFEYQFVDQKYEQLYKSEMVVSKLSNIFAGIALFIACLGLLGLATFTAERRSKEISIRKVLGASVPNLIALLSGSFIRLVIIAVLIAAPIAYLVMDNWLENFAYHTDIGWGLFLISGLLAILIAWLTIGYQSLKAAIGNPINSLRSE